MGKTSRFARSVRGLARGSGAREGAEKLGQERDAFGEHHPLRLRSLPDGGGRRSNKFRDSCLASRQTIGPTLLVGPISCGIVLLDVTLLGADPLLGAYAFSDLPAEFFVHVVPVLDDTGLHLVCYARVSGVADDV